MRLKCDRQIYILTRNYQTENIEIVHLEFAFEYVRLKRKTVLKTYWFTT